MIRVLYRIKEAVRRKKMVEAAEKSALDARVRSIRKQFCAGEIKETQMKKLYSIQSVLFAIHFMYLFMCVCVSFNQRL